ncbi:MAG TPA: FecR domain-containing protein [Blastocatellia bacterium]|jgi:hypothetical protein|nr:FecR domain-containing protein [Blastocatellia bacterium]
MKITKMLLPTAVLLVLAAPAFGQQRRDLTPDEQSQYVVSAKAGAVNIVEGDASFKRGKADWDPLIAGDELRTGDVVRTEADGRVELLLNPGSFLRIAEGSEFVFVSTSIHNLRLDLTKGSAIVEASAIDAPIRITAGKTRFSITQSGIYRLGVGADGKAEVWVRKGKLIVAGKTVKGGKKVLMSGTDTPLISSFDKKAQDNFDTWSKDRAKVIIAANRKLSNRAVQRSVSLGFAGGNLWLYDPFYRSYTFLPYGYGFNSPYGGGYRTCNPHFNPWRNNGNGGSVAGGSGYGGGRSGGGAGSGSGGSVGGGTGTGGGMPSGGNGGGSSAPPTRSTYESTSKGRIVN